MNVEKYYQKVNHVTQILKVIIFIVLPILDVKVVLKNVQILNHQVANVIINV